MLRKWGVRPKAGESSFDSAKTPRKSDAAGSAARRPGNTAARRAWIAIAVAVYASGCGKTKALPPADAGDPAEAFEAPPSWLPVEGPPGGRDRCARANDEDGPVSAARACFTKRVKPALLAVAKTRRLRDLPLGSRAHLEHQLASTPSVRCGDASEGEAKPQYGDDPNRTMLGAASNVMTGRRYFRCSIDHAAPRTPPDGGFYLGAYVDAESLDVVYVYVPECC